MSARVLRGDCLKVLAMLPPDSFHGCLCDPPYGLTANKKGGSGAASVNLDSPYGRARIGTGNGSGGFMGMKWDAGVPDADVWREVLRVMKPGGFLLAFGGTRTHHRLMCAIEDAGFEIRDCLMWLYGSGFPKSLNISRAIDKAAGAEREVVGTSSGPNASRYDGERYAAKRETRFGVVQYQPSLTAPATPEAARFSGYGTALKPAYEPIIVAMKPCDGTFVENALKWGVAGINVDRGRVGYESTRNAASNPLYRVQNGYRTAVGSDSAGSSFSLKPDGGEVTANPLGRWPANVILDEEAARMLDEQSGILTSGNNPSIRHASKTRDIYGLGFGDQCLVHRGTDSGGASRFFYCAKASRKERGEVNKHPTVKPLKLCEYLAKLILPPEGDTPRRLLVPFAGSGSEMIGARRAGWDEVVGAERDRGYCRIARKRLGASTAGL